MKHMIVWALAAILCAGFTVGCKQEGDKGMSNAPEAKEPPMFPESTVPPAETVKPAPAPAPVDTTMNEPPPAPRPAPKESYAEPKKTAKTYTIAKGDTLQKISEHFYGTTKKWKKIQDANKDVIKDPAKLKVGTKIKIPPA